MSLKLYEYDRASAVRYARQWALRRNPRYYNFNGLGGDCTNFASQCIYAGAPVMNFTADTGWYYRSLNDRAAAWTGVEFLYRFMVNNQGEGPFAEEIALSDAQAGDVVQFGRMTGDFYHSPVITQVGRGQILVCAHSYDAYDRELSSYYYEQIRVIHVLGYRREE